MPASLGLPRDTVNPDADVPVSLQLAVAMRWAIIQKAVPVGEQLPSEPECAEWFSVSRDTVSRCFGILRRVGVVSTRRGLGHFVASRPEIQELTLKPGARVTVQRPTSDAHRACLDHAGAELYTPIVVVHDTPDAEPAVYDAAAVTIVTTAG
jgi:DNA-binding transcriptional regulator YhcF (GntR family)